MPFKHKDAATRLHFLHWLESHDLRKELFDEVGAMLEERGLLMRQGMIIAASPSTKNKQKWTRPVLVERHWLNWRHVFRTEPGW